MVINFLVKAVRSTFFGFALVGRDYIDRFDPVVPPRGDQRGHEKCSPDGTQAVARFRVGSGRRVLRLAGGVIVRYRCSATPSSFELFASFFANINRKAKLLLAIGILKASNPQIHVRSVAI